MAAVLSRALCIACGNTREQRREPRNPIGRGRAADQPLNRGYHAIRPVDGTRPGRSTPGARVISSECLLHRVAGGDPQAVRECVSRFGGLVWSLARRVGLLESDAEDVVHEVFTELWQTGGRYDPSIASETAFVATIARRRIIDRKRKITRYPVKQALTEATPVPPAETGAAKTTELSEEARRAAEALTRLSPEQQRVLRLSVYEGLSHESISRATGLPLGTVKTHARRGLIALRNLLGVNPGGEQGAAAPARDGEFSGAVLREGGAA